MKKIIFAFFLTLITLFAHAQIKKPVTWSEPVLSKSNPSVGETVEIIFKASVIPDWYLYSSDFVSEFGPNVTTFTYTGSSGDKIEGAEIMGDVKAINPKKTYDDIFEMEYTYFEPMAEFRQKIKITGENPTIKVKIDYQTCKHEGACITDKQKFTVEIKTAEAKTEVKTTNSDVKTTVTETKNNGKENVKNEANTTSKSNTKEESTSNSSNVNETKSEDSTSSNTGSTEEAEVSIRGEEKFSSVNGDFAKGNDGADYVLIEDKWYKVPKGNSSKFYRKYLMLGGKHEE